MLGVGPSGAQTQEDVDEATAERQRVRDDAQAVASRIDALGDRAEDLATKLDLLDITIAATESRLEVAEGRASATTSELARVDAEISELETVKDDLETILVESAVEQYVSGQERGQGTVLSAEDPVDWSLRQGMYSIVVADIATIKDQLRVIDARLVQAHADASELAAAAQEELIEVTALRAENAAAQATEAEVLGKVQQRLDARLSEAESLARIDADLSEEIRRGEEEIARRLAIAEALKKADEEAKAAAEAEAQAETEAESEADSEVQVEETQTESGEDRSSLIARADEITNVRGIQIHNSIADQLLGLIIAAEGDGIILSGSGWRSTEYQIQLRIQNCGSSDYAIFDAPSEACYPPTARPATSNHEAGLAIDVTANGRAVIDRTSAEFLWLAANAPRFGFYNLWSEPWHWSVDGR